MDLESRDYLCNVLASLIPELMEAIDRLEASSENKVPESILDGVSFVESEVVGLLGEFYWENGPAANDDTVARLSALGGQYGALQSKVTGLYWHPSDGINFNHKVRERFRGKG